MGALTGAGGGGRSTYLTLAARSFLAGATGAGLGSSTGFLGADFLTAALRPLGAGSERSLDSKSSRDIRREDERCVTASRLCTPKAAAAWMLVAAMAASTETVENFMAAGSGWNNGGKIQRAAWRVGLDDGGRRLTSEGSLASSKIWVSFKRYPWRLPTVCFHTVHARSRRARDGVPSRDRFHSLRIMALQNTPRLHTHRNRNGISLMSMIRWSIIVSSICGFGYMWSIYCELRSNGQLGGVPSSGRQRVMPRNHTMTKIRGAAETKKEVHKKNHTTVSKSLGQTPSTTGVSSVHIQTKQNRLYCMVPFIWTPSAFPAYHAIRETWGKRCHITKFFIDPVIGDNTVGFYNMTDDNEAKNAEAANLTLPDDVVVLHSMKRPWHTCSDKENEKIGKPIGNCRNIWEKIWRAWVYTVFGSTGSHVPGAGQNKNGKADVYNAEWFVKVDADTYLFPDNLPRYVESKGWSYNDQHYFGHVLNHRMSDRKVSIVAGAAVFFSRATLLSAAKTFNTMSMRRGDQEDDGTCRDAYTGTEEVVTAVCLKYYVKADPAIDGDGRELVSLYEVELILEYNRTEQGEWWFWEGKKRVPCHDNPNDCIGHLPLAFHHLKKADDIRALENEFYSDNVNSRQKRQRYVTQYFDKVRLAMRNAEAMEARGVSVVPTSVEEPKFPATSKNESVMLHRTSTSANRLYCMVPFIWTPKFLPQYEAIHKTWGQRCDVLKFFIDPIIGSDNDFQDVRVNSTAKASLPNDVIVVENIKRPWNKCMGGDDDDAEITCRNIWEKLWRMWILMDETGELDKAEWFTKVDTDTYLFTENLKRYVEDKQWLPSEQHYFGHVLMHTKAQDDVDVTIVAGAAVFFSQ